MAAAMAAGKGLCGIDIQKITPRLSKVQERFCRPAEKGLLQASLPPWQPEKERTELAKLWAAKEALRKASNIKTLPGFLELELVAIEEAFFQGESASWIYIFSWNRRGTPANYKYMVVITLVKDYALALTARDDTMC
jgi:phosphopantetheinyl transferase (holo-ACP synthase)